MRSVHLGMMELERNGEIISEPSFPVSAPDDEWIVEDAAVHTNSAINLRIDDSRSADDHALLGKIPVGAGVGYFCRAFQILLVEGLHILVKPDIAGTHFAGTVLNDRINGQSIILNQPVADRQQIELFNPRSSLTDTPIHQHIEFQPLPAADPYQPCYIQRFEEGHHRVGSLHP